MRIFRGNQQSAGESGTSWRPEADGAQKTLALKPENLSETGTASQIEHGSKLSQEVDRRFLVLGSIYQGLIVAPHFWPTANWSFVLWMDKTCLALVGMG